MFKLPASNQYLSMLDAPIQKHREYQGVSCLSWGNEGHLITPICFDDDSPLPAAWEHISDYLKATVVSSSTGYHTVNFAVPTGLIPTVALKSTLAIEHGAVYNSLNQDLKLYYSCSRYDLYTFSFYCKQLPALPCGLFSYALADPAVTWQTHTEDLSLEAVDVDKNLWRLAYPNGNTLVWDDEIHLAAFTPLGIFRNEFETSWIDPGYKGAITIRLPADTIVNKFPKLRIEFKYLRTTTSYDGGYSGLLRS